MRYLLLRRSDPASEAGQPLPPAAAAFIADMAAAGVLRASCTLLPSTHGVRLTLDGDKVSTADGPFADPHALLAGFAIIDVPSRQDALDWLGRWPIADEGAQIELREGGCPGGCAEVIAAPGSAQGACFAVLLRSSTALEDEVPVSQQSLDVLDLANAAEAAKGVLLGADGLRTSARGARLTVSGGKHAIVDGPFTEIKEMIAGYWLIRAPSLQDALAWAARNPYPCGPRVEVEVREALAPAAPMQQPFTPALQQAEQRMRAAQLESGMHERLAQMAHMTQRR